MDFSQTKKLRYVVIFLLVVTTACLYYRVSGFHFINLDDNTLLTDNPHVSTGLSWDNMAWAFTGLDKDQWVPVTWISHMADFQLFGMHAGGHHVMNVLYHLATVLLLQLFLYKATGKFWQSTFVAALFALHPLHVEPVAWVTSRKDLLSTLLMVASLFCYRYYGQRPGVGRYLAFVGVYVLGLMAKPMLVTLPFLLLLLDYWPLERKTAVRALLYEKIPLLVIAVAFAALASVTQFRSGAIANLHEVPLASRLGNVILAYAAYCWKTVWPGELAVVYPLRLQLPPWEVASAALFLAVVSAFVVRFGKSYRYLVVGWLWFLLSLVPVIGIVQIGKASMADRYTYLPLIGLFIMIAWGIPDAVERWLPRWRRPVLTIAAIAVLAALVAGSSTYLACWHDSIALYTHALGVASDNPMILNNLGSALWHQGRRDEAARYFFESIRLDPTNAAAHYNLGSYLMLTGNFALAADHFGRAVELDPGYEEARRQLAFCRQMLRNLAPPARN